ncbi:lipase member H [Lepisosteus oculatus]|uniref:lipase member H n=1 Tax=Lepisosteus oculatus TaxID=7918 RepID=UPI00372482F3
MFHWWILVFCGTFVFCEGKDIQCDTITDLDFHDSFIGTKLHVRLLLYTKETQLCGEELSHTNISHSKSFDLSRNTTFLIHGYRPTGAPPVWVNKTVELLVNSDNMNVIVVDWNRGAANLNYFTAVTNTKKAAENLTEFVKLMKENGASLSSIHMIGVSLGAHLSGFVGSMLNGKIGRITGLDPAGPLFTGKPPEERLDSSDAEFVDVLHTDMDALGFRLPLGHIDFYANGGADQPGCPKTIFSGKKYFVCDHQRSVFLFMSSLNKTCGITAYPCSSYSDFLDGKCLDCKDFHPAPCPLFGYYVNKWKDVLLKLGQTKTYFSTTAKDPFCKHNYLVDIVTWNQNTRWGFVTIKLFSGRNVTEAKIDHKAAKFEQYTETRLLAQFDEDFENIQKISLKFSTGNMIGPRYKLRVIRFKLRPLEKSNRTPLCRYDLILEENSEVSFRPIPCQDMQF